MGDFEAHNVSDADLETALSTVLDAVPPGHIINIVYNHKTKKFHIAYWTYT